MKLIPGQICNDVSTCLLRCQGVVSPLILISVRGQLPYYNRTSSISQIVHLPHWQVRKGIEHAGWDRIADPIWLILLPPEIQVYKQPRSTCAVDLGKVYKGAIGDIHPQVTVCNHVHPQMVTPIMLEVAWNTQKARKVCLILYLAVAHILFLFAGHDATYTSVLTRKASIRIRNLYFSTIMSSVELMVL